MGLTAWNLTAKTISCEIVERNYALFGTHFKPGPVPDVLFRPEEIHGRSGLGNIFEPFLFSIDGNAILSGKIVKGCEGGDEIRIGE